MVHSTIQEAGEGTPQGENGLKNPAPNDTRFRLRGLGRQVLSGDQSWVGQPTCKPTGFSRGYLTKTLKTNRISGAVASSLTCATVERLSENISTRRSNIDFVLREDGVGDISDVFDTSDSSDSSDTPVPSNIQIVTFNAMDGEVSPEKKEYVKNYGTYNGLPTPIKDLSTFLGWCASPDGGEIINENTPVTDDSERIFYAYWNDGSGDIIEESSDESYSEDDTYSVTFYYDDTDGKTKVFHIDRGYEPGSSYHKTPQDIPEEDPQYPYRSAGYWHFDGWEFVGGTAPETITTNLSFKAKYSPGIIRIPLEWNDTTPTQSDQYLECTWGKIFTNLSVAPVNENGDPCSGAFLRTDSGRTVAKTHNSKGIGITTADYAEMGSETSDVVGVPFDVPGCKIVVLWKEPLKWNTIDDIRNAIGNIPCPFADDPSSRTEFLKEPVKNTDVSFKKGFPKAYTVPIINPETGEVNSPDEARVITRKQMNAIGNIGTREQFFEQCGGYYTFDERVCNAIGGYPETAVLRFYDPDNHCIRTVYSLVDNNYWNFLTNGVDGVHWKYVDDNYVVDLRIDYSDFIDLSNVLFVETGQPDFYEVPYDSFLQLHSFSFCYLQCQRRPEHEYVRAITGSSDDGTLAKTERKNGEYCAGFEGSIYLDIYNKDTNTIRSIEIRSDGSYSVHVSYFVFVEGVKDNGAFWLLSSPRYVVTQGSFFLNKGDEIRVRGVYESDVWKYYNKSLNSARVISKRYSDMEVRRQYLCKFANLYRIGWE